MSTAEDERFVQLLEPPIADLGSSAIASAITNFWSYQAHFSSASSVRVRLSRLHTCTVWTAFMCTGFDD